MPVIRLRLLGGVELSAHEHGRAQRLSLPPKPLALLAYLAVASAEAMPVRRDLLLALFWPELSTDRARGALRQILFHLRRVVGDDVVSADRENIALVQDALSCDVVDFVRRLASGDRSSAMDLYRGPLLGGFFVDGVSAALEEWIDGARRRAGRARQSPARLTTRRPCVDSSRFSTPSATGAAHCARPRTLRAGWRRSSKRSPRSRR